MSFSLLLVDEAQSLRTVLFIMFMLSVFVVMEFIVFSFLPFLLKATVQICSNHLNIYKTWSDLFFFFLFLQECVSNSGLLWLNWLFSHFYESNQPPNNLLHRLLLLPGVVLVFSFLRKLGFSVSNRSIDVVVVFTHLLCLPCAPCIALDCLQ